MTKAQAAEILGVPANASAAEVRRRYQELFTDLQVRLTNAPTAQLRKRYQEGLRDSRTACEVLAPGALGGSAADDLPSAQPSEPARMPSPAERSAWVPSVTRGGAGESPGLSRGTVVLGGIAIALATVAAFLGVERAARRDPPPVAPVAQVTPTPGAYLLVAADAACTVEVDGEAKGTAHVRQPLRVPAAIGRHIVKATSLDHSASWQEDAEVGGPGETLVFVNIASDIELAKHLAAGEAAAAAEAIDDLKRQRRTMGDIRSIATAVEAFGIDFGRYPPSGGPAVDPLLPGRGVSLAGMAGHISPTYIKSVPMADGWNSWFLYATDTPAGGYIIESAGKDGLLQPQPPLGPTNDPNADIIYRNGDFIQWPKEEHR